MKGLQCLFKLHFFTFRQLLLLSFRIDRAKSSKFCTSLFISEEWSTNLS